MKMEDSGRQIQIDPLKDVTGSLPSWLIKMDPVTLLVAAEKVSGLC